MRRQPLVRALGAIVVLGAVAMAPASEARSQEAPSVSVDVRVWQHDEDELDIRVGARPSGGLWQTLGVIPLPLDDGLSSTGRHRYGDIELDVAVEVGFLSVTVEVRVWQDVFNPRNLYISARASRGSWLTLGTVPLALDRGDGRFRYSDIRIDAPLPRPAVTTLSAFGVVGGTLAVAGDGSMVATNPGTGTVERISPAGRPSATFGQGARGEPRDGPAAEAEFYGPRGVAVARDGSIYVGDTRLIDGAAAGLVRRIAPDGTVSTVAGGATEGSWRDLRAPAGEASFGTPNGLAVDNDGGIFVLGHNAILYLSLAGEGEVRVVAGRASTGATGVADGPGRGALFGYLWDGAIDVDDAGNVYVLDPLPRSSRSGEWVSRTAVRMIDERGVVTTLFEDRHPSFGGILTTSRGGLAVTADGSSIYLANTAQNQIVRLTRAGELRAVAGTGARGHADGPCDEALFDRPGALALADDDRTLLVVDQRGAYIRQIDLDESAACAGRLPLAAPEAPPPKLAGVESHVVARFPSGIRPQGPLAAGTENVLVGVFDGSLSHVVLSPDRPAMIVPIIGGTGGQDGSCETAELSGPDPVHVAVEPDGSIWFVQRLPWGRFGVRRITWTVPEERVAGLDCQVTTITTLPALGSGGVALDSQGNLLVSGEGLHRVSPGGAVSTVLRGGTRGVAFADGSAYVIESDREETTVAITRVDAAGRPVVLWTGPEAQHGGGILSLQDIALAAAPNGTLYAWSGPDQRIVRIRGDGSASIVYDVTDDLGGPHVYVDPRPYVGADGHLWINAWNQVIDSTEIHRFRFPDDAPPAPAVSE